MPPKGRKRKSDQDAPETADQMVPVKTGSPSESPRKRRRIGVTLAQKQALIDNLQIELTERARKLRAQYNLQAQGLRTRIEIRVNRIPVALRKVKMGELVEKYLSGQPPKPAAAVVAAAMTARPPPVPEKDYHSVRSTAASHRQSPAPALAPRAGPGRPKRSSDEMAGGDKENYDASIDNPKKRHRGHAAAEAGPDPSKVLSPTSSNLRLNPRDRAPASPSKSLIARPASPMKQASSSNLLSNMVEKARSTRAAATRKTTTSSTASSAAGRAPATRTRKVAAPVATTKASTARAVRRASGISEASDGSTSTVVRKMGTRAATGATKAAAPAPPPAKRTVMNTLKKGVSGATTKKAPAPKATQPVAAPTTRSGRVLRKRE